jgi:hypothetical protein
MAGFKKATKAAAKLRAAIFGPSGAGKTYTSLRMAKGLGGRIAVIDTERGSAAKYSDRFEFDVLELEDQSIQGYVEAIALAGAEGYGVLVIDSLSHGWQSLLEEVEKLAKAKYRGNTWSAWSEGTPLQRKLVQAILSFPGHVLATMRSKTEWTTVDDGKGRKSPQRVGLAPEQGKGVEYEFDLLVEISTEHIANVIKDRTGKFQDKLLDRPGEEFGRQLASWLSEGTAGPVEAIRRPPATVEPESAQASPPDPKAGSSDRLVARAVVAIGRASTVAECDELRERIDARLVAGEIANAEAEALLAELDAKESELRSRQEATDAVA